jgi:beta-lactamase class A
LNEADRDSKWGEFYKAPAGTKLKLAEVLRKSLVESDNTAHKMLYRLVGVEDAQALSQELNLEDLFDESGKITAREYARLLRSLYTSSYLKAQNSMILEQMTNDQVVKFLIRGLGEGIDYAHKFGESAAIRSYLDAGIVYVPNRPFIIVVMVQDIEGRVGLTREMAGDQIFEVVAHKTYDYVVDER